MQLEINNPELEALIANRLESGGFQSVEEVLIQVFAASQFPSEGNANGDRHNRKGKSLAALFADSPFSGLDLRFDRDDDTGRSTRL